MEIIKADWLCHLKDTRKGGGPSSIFSISVDSTGKRLASAGLDSTVRIWNLEALKNSNEPKLLAAMTRHDGAVLCVKWSPQTNKGSYLASAADDSIVLIWRQDKEASGLSGAFEFDHEKLGLNPPVESYRVVHRLTDHTSDVAGIEWSPDGKWMASCGLDGIIIVWDVEAGFRLAQRLEGHKNFVKGLAWDPCGTFLASQSDDHSMIIWRTRDWKAEAVLTKPFDQAHEETFFRRPSWSPDGKLIAASNAINGKQPVVSVVLRDQWTPEIAFVGHLLAVEVAKFSPCLYHRPDKGDGSEVETGPSYLCAAGSQDCNTSIWSNHSSKPIAVLTDLFEHAVMDLEWFPDGLSLLIAAYDGTIAIITFDTDLVGKPLKTAEQAAYLSQIRKSGPGDITRLPTSIEQIKVLAQIDTLKSEAENSQLSQDHNHQMELVESRKTQLKDDEYDKEEVILPRRQVASKSSVSLSPTKQVETKTKEGKRRITPLLVQESSQPAGNLPSQQQSSMTVGAVVNGPAHSKTPANSLTQNIRPIPEEKLVLKVSTQLQHRFLAKSNSIQIEAKNNLKGASSSSKLSFVENSKIFWETQLTSSVLFMEALDEILAVVTQDSSFSLFDTSGRRLLPPVVIDANPVAITLGHLGSKHVGMVIVSAIGTFKIWDLSRIKVVASGSLASIAKNCFISSLQLLQNTRDGFLMSVGFSDGRIYSYIEGLDAFVQTNSSVFKALEYDYSEETTDATGSAVDQEQISKNALALIKGLLLEDSDLTRKHSINALESRLALSALLFTERATLKDDLFAYATRLGIEGLSGRALELFRDIAMSRGVFGFPLFDGVERAEVLEALKTILLRHFSHEADELAAEMSRISRQDMTS